MKEKNGTTNFPIRINNVLRYKATKVAEYNGRTLSEHIKWLLNASINNYEINEGKIDLTQEFANGAVEQ